jgi:hypothetical protein
MAPLKGGRTTRGKFQLGEEIVNRLEEQRHGSQRPLNFHIPEYYDSSLADRALVFLKVICQFELDEWQEWVLYNSLLLDKRGKFSAKEVCLLVPRQNGKTYIAEARELVGLFLIPEEQYITHSAQVFRTAKESYWRMLRRLRKIPELWAQVESHPSSNDNVAIQLTNGKRLVYSARGKDPGRGLSGDLVVLDEGYAITDDVMEALMPSMSARPNAQMWYCSSTGMEDSDVLLRMRTKGMEQRARKLAGESLRTDRMLLAEWCAEEGCAIDDIEQWYLSNPALGLRIELDTIFDELGSMSEKGFKRERLGLWHDMSVRNVIDPDTWRDCGVVTAQMLGDYCAALDISPDASQSSISVAGHTRNGKRYIEVIWAGPYITTEVLSELHGFFNAPSQQPLLLAVQGASSAAQALVPRIETMGIEVLSLGQKDVAAGCEDIKNRAYQGTLVHNGEPSLAVAVNGATKYRIGAKVGTKDLENEEDLGWGWARRDSSIDITGLCACTWASRAVDLKINLDAKEKKPWADKPKKGKIW